MMKFTSAILFLVVFSDPGGIGTTTQEFDSMEACEKAAVWIEEEEVHGMEARGRSGDDVFVTTLVADCYEV